MIKKSENNNTPSERARIKPPEIRPRTPGAAPARPSTTTPRTHEPSSRPPQGPRPAGAGGSRNRREQSRHSMPRPGAIHPQNSKMGPKPVVARDPNEKSNPDAVRFVPLGGLEEVGRNC